MKRLTPRQLMTLGVVLLLVGTVLVIVGRLLETT